MADPLRSGAIFRYKLGGIPTSGQKLPAPEPSSVNKAALGTSFPQAPTSLPKAPPPTPATQLTPHTPYTGIADRQGGGDMSSGTKNSLLKQRFDLIYRATPLPPTVDVQAFRPPTNPPPASNVMPSPAMYMPPPPPPNTMHRSFDNVHRSGPPSNGGSGVRSQNYAAPSYMQSSPYQQHSNNLVPPHAYTPPAQAHYSSFPQPNFSQGMHYQSEPNNMSYQIPPRSAPKANYSNQYPAQDIQYVDRYATHYSQDNDQEMEVQYEAETSYPADDDQPLSESAATEDDYPTDEDVHNKAVQENITSISNHRSKYGSPSAEINRRTSITSNSPAGRLESPSPEKLMKTSPAVPSSSSAKKSSLDSSSSSLSRLQSPPKETVPSNRVEEKPVARRGVGRGGMMDSLLAITGASQPPKRVDPPKVIEPPPISIRKEPEPSLPESQSDQIPSKGSKRSLAEPVMVQALKQNVSSNKNITNERIIQPNMTKSHEVLVESQVAKKVPSTEIKVDKKTVVMDKTPQVESKPAPAVVPTTTRSGRVSKGLHRLIEEMDMVQMAAEEDEILEIERRTAVTVTNQGMLIFLFDFLYWY